MAREGQAEVLGGVQKWLIPCNWKFPAENFSGDSYHNITHRSVDLVGIGPSGSSRRDMRELQMAPQAACLHSRPRPSDDRLCAAARTSRPPAAYQNSPIVSEYFRHCEEERRRRPRRVRPG